MLLLLFMLAVHAKSIVAILHLLVALSQHFRAPIRLPDHVSIQVVVVQVGIVLLFSFHIMQYSMTLLASPLLRMQLLLLSTIVNSSLIFFLFYCNHLLFFPVFHFL